MDNHFSVWLLEPQNTTVPKTGHFLNPSNQHKLDFCHLQKKEP